MSVSPWVRVEEGAIAAAAIEDRDAADTSREKTEENNRLLEVQRDHAQRASAEDAEKAGTYLSPVFSVRIFEALNGIRVTQAFAGLSGVELQLHENIANPEYFSAGTSASSR
jgi:hypothetical protein